MRSYCSPRRDEDYDDGEEEEEEELIEEIVISKAPMHASKSAPMEMNSRLKKDGRLKKAKPNYSPVDNTADQIIAARYLINTWMNF